MYSMPQVKVNGLKIVWSPKLWSGKAHEITCSRDNFEKLPMYTNCKCTLCKPNCSFSFFFLFFSVFLQNLLHNFRLKHCKGTMSYQLSTVESFTLLKKHLLSLKGTLKMRHHHYHHPHHHLKQSLMMKI